MVRALSLLNFIQCHSSCCAQEVIQKEAGKRMGQVASNTKSRGTAPARAVTTSDTVPVRAVRCT
jgi:hypothetical protein